MSYYLRQLIKERQIKEWRSQWAKENIEAMQTNRHFPPVVPFRRYELHRPLAPHQQTTLTLRSNPEQPDSPTYNLTVAHFNDGTPEQWFDWQDQYQEVVIGQHITEPIRMIAMMRRLLRGDALASLNQAVRQYGLADSAEAFDRIMREVTTDVLPARALARQIAYMTHGIRRVVGMKIDKQVKHVNEMNQQLSRYPPNFSDAQRMHQDRLIAIHENTLLPHEHMYLKEQGFDPSEHTLREFVEIVERCEKEEDEYRVIHKRPTKNVNTIRMTTHVFLGTHRIGVDHGCLSVDARLHLPEEMTISSLIISAI